MTRKPMPNRHLAQWRVWWLIEHSALHQSRKAGWCIDSLVFQNPLLSQVAKHYRE